MLSEKSNKFNLSQSISIDFDELSIFKALSKANIYKRNGTEAKTIFSVIFSLVFYGRTWNQLKSSKQSSIFPSKDSVYRFLANQKFNWRTFLNEVSLKAVTLVSSLTSERRTKVLIIDDSPINRSRSKKTEMLSTIFDHVSHSYFKGYHLMTLGWSDGSTFIPIDFSLVATVKKLINTIDQTLDKRTIAYKRRVECLCQKNDLAVEMIRKSLNRGIAASYVLMDSWFTSPKMITQLKEAGIDYIGMIKNTPKQYFKYGKKSIVLSDLYHHAMKTGKKEFNGKGVLSAISVKTTTGIQMRIIFVTNRNKKNEWLAIGTSDMSLCDEEIIRLYEYRWSIEVFFKTIKSVYHLEKEFHVNSFDSLIAHTTIVFTRYIVSNWEIRKNNDDRTIGELFYLMCDEVRESTFMEALMTLLAILEDIRTCIDEKASKYMDKLVENWKEQLPQWMQESLFLSSPLLSI